MKLEVDKDADALYLYLDDSEIVMTEQVAPGIIVDYNQTHDVVGIELLHLSKRSSAIDFSQVQFQSA